jgi:hypothetical protein
MLPGNENNDNSNVSNWVVIPYFNGDKGFKTQRPLTAPTLSYLCPSIQVLTGGVPGPAVFIPGNDLEVQVQVGNYGNGALVSNAKVSVFWAEANSGGFSKKTLLGMQSVAVPNWGPVKTTPIIKGKIPLGITGHICLLVGVDFGQGIHWTELIHSTLLPDQLMKGPLRYSPDISGLNQLCPINLPLILCLLMITSCLQNGNTKAIPG